MPASYVSTILAEAGLKGYWRLGEATVGGGAVDAASGNNGVYINTPTLGVAGAISGDSDKAVQFARASAEYVQIPDHLAQRFASGPCTVEFWFKLTTSDGTNSAAFAQVSGNGPYLEINGPAIGVWRWKPAGGSVGATTAGFAVTDTTTWHHLVATVDASNNYKIYLDGVDRTTVIGTPAFGYVGTSQGTIIGAADGAGSVPFNGSIDEVALYNVVLTPAQVLNHYQVGTATPAAGAIATFPGSGPNTTAAFRAMVADTTISRIEISAGTYTGWHIGGSSPETTWAPDRTAAFPLVITTVAGAAVIFDGTGVPSGDGWLYPGDWRTAGTPAQVGYITIDGTLNGGTITLQNYNLAQQGLINPIRASHLTIDHIRVRSITTSNGANTFTAWCVYVHMNGSLSASDNLQFDGWDVIGPTDHSLNGVQSWQDPGVNGLNVRNWTAANLNRGILVWAHVTNALMEGWNGTSVTKPVSTDGIASGITRNNTFTASGAPTILAPFVDGGGNVWNATTATTMGATDAGVSGEVGGLSTGIPLVQSDPGLSGDVASFATGVALAVGTVIAYVQGAQNVPGGTIASGATLTAALAAAPTPGNLLLAMTQQAFDDIYTMAAGWTLLGADTPSYIHHQGDPFARRFYYRIAQAGDATTIATLTNTNGTPREMGIQVVEYSGLGATPVFAGLTTTNTGPGLGSSATWPIPSQTPTAGVPVLMVVMAGINWSGGGVLTYPAGWSDRVDTSNGPNSWHISSIADQIVASPSGSYDGNLAVTAASWDVTSFRVTASSNADAGVSGDTAFLTSVGAVGGPAAVLRATDAAVSSDFARIGPSATAGIPIEVTIATGASPTVTIAVLEGARQARWYDPLNEIGTGSFVIARTDPKAGLIAKGNIATFRLQGVARYAILVETLEVVVASVNGQSGEYVSVAGRGLEAVADKARLAPGTGTFGTVSAASVLVTAYDAAKARGTLPAGFTYDFTGALDSAGLGWDDAAPYTLPNGTRYLDILRMLPTIGIDVAITPTMVLRAFRDGLGTDRTGQVVFRQGKHLRGEIKRAQQGAQQVTRMWVEGKSGSVVQIFGDESDLAVGVREDYLKITTTDEPAILGAAGQQAIEASTQAAKAFSLPLLHGLDEGDYEPYIDYGKGDTVLVNVPGVIANERARIVAIAIAATEDGGYQVDVDGNAIVYEELVRLKRELDALAAVVV